MILFIFLCISVVHCCTFTNWNFSQPLNVGWTVSETNPTPFIDGNNYLVLGDISTETTGNASIYQDFTITSCTQNITINIAAYTKDNNINNDQQYIIIKNPNTNELITNIFSTLLGFNQHFAQQWYNIHCNVCDGSCNGVNLTDIGIMPLRLEFKVHQSGNLNAMGYSTPTALIIQDVCLE